MARQTRSVSLPAELNEYVDSNMDNFSGWVQEQVREHKAANELTPEERLREELEAIEEEKRAVEEEKQELEDEENEIQRKLSHHQEREQQIRNGVCELFDDVVQRPEKGQERIIRNKAEDIDGITPAAVLGVWDSCTMHAGGDDTSANGSMVDEDYDEYADEVDDLFGSMTPREEDEVGDALDDHFSADE